MENVPLTFQAWVTTYGIKIVAAIVIFFVGRWIAQLIKTFVRGAMRKNNVDETLVGFIGNLVYVALMTFIVIAVLAKIDIQTGSFIAVIGAAGLAVGLALQGSLSNFAAGVLLILFKPFKVGDFIEGGGAMGTVEQIGIFTTELKSPDNKKIIVPNAKMTGDKIVNFSANDSRRVDLVAGVSYSDDLAQVKSVLQDILAGDPRVLQDPAATVAVLELADNSVNFVVRPWVKAEDYWDVYFDTQQKIKERFDAEGISIPFPQRDVHLIQES